jgi:cysteine desulfurase
LDYAAGVAGNPSSPHEEGRLAKKTLEDARKNIARLLEVQADDVIFTSGATEANALAIFGLPKKGDHVLYLPSAHSSIVENMKLLKTEGVLVEELPIKNYQVDIGALKKMLRPETVLVSMDAVCGETGIVWNTREVKNAIGKIYLHVDASQAPMTEKITRAHFGADILTLDASKVCETRGIGILVAHRTIQLAPLYKGGGQERGLRNGSEAPELAEGTLAWTNPPPPPPPPPPHSRESFRAGAESDRAYLIKSIVDSVPNVYINGAKRQAPHILNLSLPGRDTDYLAALLDEDGFAVSTRSACETDSEAGSRAVFALTGDSERAKATLRISWGPSIGSRDLERFANALCKSVAFVDIGDKR